MDASALKETATAEDRMRLAQLNDLPDKGQKFVMRGSEVQLN